MHHPRLSRNSRKLGRKNYIKANVKKIREIQTKVKQPDEESIQQKLSLTQQIKRVKSTTKKSTIKRAIGQENEKMIPVKNELTRSQLPIPKDDVVSLCMKKFIENIKVSRNKCDTLLKKKSSNSISMNNESESSSTLASSSSQENEPHFGKNTLDLSNKVSNQVSAKSRFPNKSKNKKQFLPKEFEIVKTIYRQPTYSKAFKNEGCQTKEETNESISSSILFRYPSNGKTTKVHETAEQSSQTDIRPKPNATLRSTIPSRTALKIDRRTEAMKKYQVNKNPRFQMNTCLNKQLNSNTASNAMKIEGPKKIDSKNVIGNSNQAPNKMNASNREDFDKMYEEIQKANKMSPFARHQTEFLQNNSRKKKEINYRSMKRDYNRPKGAITLPEHKRKEYLAQIMIRRRNIMKNLQSLSDVTNETEAQQNKLKLLENLESMDHAIKMFSEDNLYIDLNNS